ncbi:hypothetical protein QJS04_geneDACA003761 [Acorus gramineus]|uniref:F-box domain-containing protein n=1 Tax=Acorus gramineus TaxID=55184 RepID=A0AAV9BFE4_ACOGR|nr:hypothetical protein QJS04_geneDACA003761 [Acorus gramineus]
MNSPDEIKVQWDSLPVEIWHSIIQRFDVDDFEPISLTCKLFLSITDRLRTTLTISNNAVAVGVLRRCRNINRINVHRRFRGDLVSLIHDISASGLPIETLDLSDQNLFPSQGLLKMRKTLGKTLKTLICYGIPSLNNEDLVVISEAFPALEELDISKVGFVEPHYDFGSFREKGITDAGIKALASNLARLRKINVSGFHLISDASLFSLLSNCASLSEVLVLNCNKISANGIASVIAQRPSLVSLAMCTRWLPVFTDARALQRLHICHSILSDNDLLLIANSSLPLREFCVPFCSGFSLRGLAPLLQAHPSLTHLNLISCGFLTDESMASLAQNLREVTSIDLSSSRLTEFTFMCLVKCCPLLVELNMSDTDLGTHRDLRFCSMKSSTIRSLNVSCNKNFNDETLIQISSVCPELRKMDLSNSMDVCERGLIQLGLNCPHIRSLNVSYCRKVTGLGDVGFRELVTLWASYSGIGDEGLAMAVQGCGGRLQVVDLRNTKVTEYGVIVMVTGYPRLKEIIVCGEELKKVLEREGWRQRHNHSGFIRFGKKAKYENDKNTNFMLGMKVARQLGLDLQIRRTLDFEPCTDVSE